MGLSVGMSWNPYKRRICYGGCLKSKSAQNHEMKPWLKTTTFGGNRGTIVSVFRSCRISTIHSTSGKKTWVPRNWTLPESISEHEKEPNRKPTRKPTIPRGSQGIFLRMGFVLRGELKDLLKGYQGSLVVPHFFGVHCPFGFSFNQ